MRRALPRSPRTAPQPRLHGHAQPRLGLRHDGQLHARRHRHERRRLRGHHRLDPHCSGRHNRHDHDQPDHGNVFEADETVLVTLTGATSNGQPLTLDPEASQAIGTIANDDDARRWRCRCAGHCHGRRGRHRQPRLHGHAQPRLGLRHDGQLHARRHRHERHRLRGHHRLNPHCSGRHNRHDHDQPDHG